MENLNIEKFNPTKAEIARLVSSYKSLEIKGIEDKPGYLAVDEARKELKKVRINIQKTGKSMREEAVKFQKDVIDKEKELVAMVEPTELELEEKQRIIDEEKEKIKRQKLLPERKEKLQAILIVVEDDFLLLMDETKFADFYNLKNAEFLTEKERQIKEAQNKIEIDKRKIEEEKLAQEREKQHQIDLINAREEAAAQAQKEAEFKAQREKEQVDLKLKQEEESKRLEQEELEKKKKYQDFLKKHGFTEETKDEFHIQRIGNNISLYKKVSEITI